MSNDKIPGIFPIDTEILGMSYEDWTIKFWQWLTSIPAHRNPALDKTGAHCAVAQFGQPVFNLVFSDGSPGVVRRCTLRGGQHILIPINVVEVSFAEYPGARRQDELHRIAKWEFDGKCKPYTSLSIDGSDLTRLYSTQAKSPLGDLRKFRVHSRVFDVNFPDDPIFGRPGPSKAVSDGFWAIIEPLPVGKHDIHFGASLENPLTGKLFYTDSVKYEITVQ
jgi:hypothetical protein